MTFQAKRNRQPTIQRLEHRRLMAADLVFEFDGVVDAALVHDMDGDGRDELVVVHQDNVEVFDQDGQKFANAPGHSRGDFETIVDVDGYPFGMQYRGADSRYRWVGYALDDTGFIGPSGPIHLGSSNPLPQGYDFNGDQLLDIVTTTDSTVEIVYGSPVRLPQAVPAVSVSSDIHILHLPGATHGVRQVYDLTGDGAFDLVGISLDSFDRARLTLIGSDQETTIDLPAAGVFAPTSFGHLDVQVESHPDGYVRFTDRNEPTLGYVGTFSNGQFARFDLEDPMVADLAFVRMPIGQFDWNRDGVGDAWTSGIATQVLLMPPSLPLDDLEAEVVYRPEGIAVIDDAVPIGDFNGDGADEILITTTQFADVYRIGGATFERRAGYQVISKDGPITVRLNSNLIVPGHYVGDVVKIANDGFVIVYHSDGPPGVSFVVTPDGVEPVELLPEPVDPDLSVQSFDFDGDGLDDKIALANQSVGVVLSVAGDMDQDGKVDFADFLLFHSNYGRTGQLAWWEGDFDGDGVVGFSDFLIFSNGFETSQEESTPSLAFHLDFDDSVRDRSENELPLEVGSSVRLGSEGPTLSSGRDLPAVEFLGSNDESNQIVISDNRVLDDTSGSAGAVVTWLNITNDQHWNNILKTVCPAHNEPCDSFGPGRGIELQFSPTSGLFGAAQGYSTPVFGPSGSMIANGQWVHVALAWNTEGQQTIYLDGNPGAPIDIEAFGANDVSDWTIGGDALTYVGADDPNNRRLAGQLADFAIINGELEIEVLNSIIAEGVAATFA